MSRRLLEALFSAVGECVATGEAVRILCAQDASRLGWVKPLAVVRPRSADDVAATVRVLCDFGVPLYTRGGASGLSGGALVTRPGVVLDMAQMKGVLRISRRDRTVTALAGTLIGEIQKAAAALNLLYPPDPASAAFCSLGGNIAENAGGLRALKYGTTAHHLLAATVVTGSADILHLGSQTHKNVAGLNLLSLLCGSEGTLGVVTEATMRLLPAPPAVGCVSAVFETEEAAIEAAFGVLESGLLPRALEFVDGVCAKAAARVSDAAKNWACGKPFLIVEFDGTESAVRDECGQAEALLRAGALRVAAAYGKETERLWSARRVLSTALTSAAPRKVSEDICVPPSKLPQICRLIRSLSAPPHITACAYGHLGDGNLHVNFLLHSTDNAPVERLLDAVLALRGTITGEHGVGAAKLPFLKRQISPETLTLMRRIKSVFDPAGILNPQKAY